MPFIGGITNNLEPFNRALNVSGKRYQYSLIKALFLMANFKDCKAEMNTGGGFVTTSVFSELDNCVATGNYGPGFLDLSGEPVEKLLNMFPVLYQRVDMLQPGVRRDEVHELLTSIENSIRDKKVDKSFLKKAFEKLGELTSDWSSETAAQLIYLFAMKSQQIHDILQQAGILTN